jgi:hypothetical protein
VAHNPGQGDDIADDDLTQITGIGLKTAERLRAGGIRSYAALAAHSPDEIIALLPGVTGLSAARVSDWRDQATALTAEALAGPPQAALAADTPEGAADTPEGAAGNGQPYESFLVRILLSEDGSVRRTTAQHIRTGQEHHWPGLNQTGLLEFIDTVIAVPPPSSAQLAGDLSGSAHRDEVTSAAVVPPHGTSPVMAAGAAPTGTGSAAGAATQSAEVTAAQRSSLASSAVLSVERTALRAGESFTLTVNVDFAAPPSVAQLIYSAVVVARPRTGGPKRTLAQADGLLATSSSSIDIKAAGLPAGVYRLDAAVSLREPGAERPAQLAAISEGLLVQVVPA